MDDSLGDAMVYVYAAVPALLLLAAVGSALTRRWRTEKIARRRHQQLRARRAPLPTPEPATVAHQKNERLDIGAAFDAVGSRMDKVLASLDRLDTPGR